MKKKKDEFFFFRGFRSMCLRDKKLFNVIVKKKIVLRFFLSISDNLNLQLALSVHKKL